MLEYLMKCSNKVPVPSFIQTTGNVCVYVLKLLLQDSGLSPLKTRSKTGNKQKKPAFYKDKVEAMMRSAILDLLGHKPGHCQPAFFHMLIVKFPLIFWSSYKDLTNAVQSQDAKAFDRTQAAAFLANMISKEMFDEIKSEDWTQFVKSWKLVATEVIKEMSFDGKFKKNLLEEVVATCNQINLVSPGQLSLDEDVLQKLLEMKKKCDKSIRKTINKLTTGIERTGITKRKKNEKLDEVDGPSAPKKINLQDQSVSIDDEIPDNQSAKEVKHKRKGKKSRKSENMSDEKNAEILNQSVTNGDVISKMPMKSFVADLESDSAKQQGHDVNTPKSQKKKMKRKSKGSCTNEAIEDENLVDMEPVIVKLNKEENQSTTNDSSVLEESFDVSASGKKKKVKKSMNSTASDSNVLEVPIDVSASGKKKRKKSMNST